MPTIPREILRGAGVAAVLLMGPEAAMAAQEGGSELFSLDLGLMIWTWVLFLLTLFVLAWKVFPWIAGGLEERQEKIQGAIDEARRDREEARRLLEEQKKELRQARQEAQELIEEGREAGERLRKEVLEEAREEQEKMMARARREMKLERERLMEDVRREAVEVAMRASERLMRTRLDREQDRELVRDYVSEIG